MYTYNQDVDHPLLIYVGAVARTATTLIRISSPVSIRQPVCYQCLAVLCIYRLFQSF